MKINKLTCGVIEVFAGLALLGLASAPAYAVTADTSAVWTLNNGTATLGTVAVSVATGPGFQIAISPGWTGNAAADNGGAISYSSPTATTLNTTGVATLQTITFGTPVVNPILLFDYGEPSATYDFTGYIVTQVSANGCSLLGVTITCTAPRDPTVGIAVKLTGTFSTIAFTYADTLGPETDGFSVALSPTLPPSISESFTPSTIPVGTTTTLAYTITNPNASTTLTGVSFTDTLAAGLSVTTASTSTCGGTLTTTSPTSISFSGGSITGGGSCTINVTVTGGTAGVYSDQASAAGSANGGTGTVPTAASLTVLTTPTFSKAFSPSTIYQNQTSVVTFTVTNPNTVPLTGLAFTDTLPAGLVFTGSALSNSCTFGGAYVGSTLTANVGTVAASSSCTLVFTVQDTLAGTLVNTTSTLTSNAAPAPAATATLIVIASSDTAFEVSYAANLSAGESYIDLTNTGANGAPAAGPGFGGNTGNICVNVYAVDPGEELISCCSCLITPDATANLGVVRDLTSNTQTGAAVTSVTVKVYGTLPVAGALPGSVTCNNSAAGGAYAGAAIVNGLAAWNTTLHTTRTAGTYATTERPFTPATLSADELTSLQGRCATIIGNASGFGVCASCRAGALGAVKIAQ